MNSIAYLPTDIILAIGSSAALTLFAISAMLLFARLKGKAHERELWRLANQDALTGLPNRNWLMRFLPMELEQAQQSNDMVALLFIDLDNFKNVNDSLGHSAGDDLLQAAAPRLKSVLRPHDNVARLGGDEFAIILNPITAENEAALVAKHIVAAFTHPFELEQGENSVRNSISASIGISIFPRDGNNTEALLKNADIAMYQAKAEGKSHYHFYTSNLSTKLQFRLDTERALQHAIEKNQFVLFYQPRINAVTGELQSLEALVRWNHPKRGLVPPQEFIPIAEQTGLILKLGELVLEQACTQIAQWKALNLPLVPISINVSPYQFNHGDIQALFASSLKRHRVSPNLVEIEITESSMIEDQNNTSSTLTAIRAFGIKLLVDDFGTGYSSLSQLQKLNTDVLKVDRAFTKNLGNTAESEVLFRTIVSMAHALDMSVVAEGVETAEQLRILQSLSCDEIQGYLISRPIPANEAQAWMARRFFLPLQPVQHT